MTRERALDNARHHFDSGALYRRLEALVAVPSESQGGGRLDELHRYLEEQIVPEIESLGFTWEIVDNPVAGFGPFLLAERIEPDATLSVLSYGHGDVVRGYDDRWREGLSPWRVTQEGDRWYGRGTADNKGQHGINLAALACALEARGGRLGYNVKLVIEMGEETGSPGLKEICQRYRERLAADLFIASDGPRLNAESPTLFLGSRGSFNFDLQLLAREGAHHSGNWGGVLKNPAVRLANALATLVDANGVIQVVGLRPGPIPQAVRAALASLEVGAGENAPAIDPDWGEPGLSPAERLFAWNTLEILAFEAGNPTAPANAIPERAHAHCQLRYVVGSDHTRFLDHLRRHLDRHGFEDIQVAPARVSQMAATRLDPEDPWVGWALASMQVTSGKAPTLLPNLGGSLPNDVFAETLGLPTLWVPHSYPACSQHAPDEHLLGSVAREGLLLMSGLWWDLGTQGQDILKERSA
ncbi:M20 family metallopeptidase [Halomonas daqingensis]|uniref:M20 family metallopeptidase n=1 Tax=Billgrantia desiderata TaxID=52021 RepID=UPI00174DDC24|nr:M20 family metallopeptidase [Halomonas desiderata]MCE8028188.1 M20 family metallopeptidase [Halomonas desiderata]NIC36572.1 M20 family metallopeptidase [Halomonas desiderata]